MQLTTRDVTKFFSVSESTVQRWVKYRGFPAHRVNGQFRFSRAELLEWASAQQIQVSPELFDNLDEDAAVPVSLAGAMEAGGINYGVADSTKETALRAMVELMPVPANLDRQTLLNLFLAREALGSTAMGDGIAIPHVRSPLVLGVECPSITLCFLERPVEFGALDARAGGDFVLDDLSDGTLPPTAPESTGVRTPQFGVQRSRAATGAARTRFSIKLAVLTPA